MASAAEIPAPSHEVEGPCAQASRGPLIKEALVVKRLTNLVEAAETK